MNSRIEGGSSNLFHNFEFLLVNEFDVLAFWCFKIVYFMVHITYIMIKLFYDYNYELWIHFISRSAALWIYPKYTHLWIFHFENCRNPINNPFNDLKIIRFKRLGAVSKKVPVLKHSLKMFIFTFIFIFQNPIPFFILQIYSSVSSLQALLRKAFRSPGMALVPSWNIYHTELWYGA